MTASLSAEAKRERNRQYQARWRALKRPTKAQAWHEQQGRRSVFIVAERLSARESCYLPLDFDPAGVLCQ